MTDILDTSSSSVITDETIAKQQYVSYSPYLNSFNNDDEIRIAIQSRDLYVLPSQSYLYIEITARKKDGVADGIGATFIFNFLNYFFNEVRYELNGVEIDRCKNVGITSTIKRYAAQRLSEHSTINLRNMFNERLIMNRTYGFILPLNSVLGFAEDYNKIIMNAKHELILTRSRRDLNVYTSGEDSIEFTFKKVVWKIPQITLADTAKLKMLRYLERKRTINVPFRSWDLYEVPKLPQSTKHVWNVKTTNQLHRPRFVFVAFQTNKNQIPIENASHFDHCDISEVKLFLNSECFPYDNYNSDFTNTNYAEAMLALLRIQSSYYNQSEMYNPDEFDYVGFMSRAVFAFDCTRADESLLNSMIDVRIEINARNNIPNNTAAYCLLIHDNMFQYSPFNGVVNKNI